MLVLVVELRKTNRHFSGTGAGCGDYDQLSGGLNKIILAVTLVADDQINIGGVVGDRVVVVNVYSVADKMFFELYGCGLFCKTCEHDGIDAKTAAAEQIDQTENVKVVCNAQIAANLVFFDIIGVDYNYYFCFIFELHEHLQL